MSNERIDIEITDKIDPSIKTNIAAIGAESKKAHESVQKLKEALASINTSAVAQLNKALNDNANATAKLQREQAAAQKAVASLALEQQRLATEVQRTAAAQARAEAATNRVAQSQTRAAQATQAHTAVMNKLNNTSKLTRQQMLTIQYTVNDVAASLASGASPFTILMQQGGQVTQAFGGFKNTMSMIGQAMTPVRMAVAGVTAALLLYVKGLIDAKQEQAEFANTMKLTNGYAGMTYGAYQEMGKAISQVTGNSVKEAKEAVMQLGATGQFQKQQIEELATSALLIGQYTGKSAEDVIKGFTKMAEGPAAYAKELNNQFNFLTAPQLAHIQRLEETGDKSKALEEVSRRLYEYLGKNGPANLDPLAQAWRDVGNAISNAYQKFKNFVSGASTPEGILSGMKEQLAELEKPLKPNMISGNVDKAAQNANDEAKRVLREKISAQESLIRSQGQGAALVSEELKAQRESADATERLKNKWGGMVDNIGAAKKQIQAFRTDLDKALAKNPNDEDALFAKKNQKDIEAAIMKKAMPDKFKDDKKSANLAQKRIEEMAEVNAALDAQIKLFGLLGTERDKQQQLDGIELSLGKQKIKLTDDERNSIKSKIEAIQENAQFQSALDRVYEGANGALRDYDNTQAAAIKLLGEGKISAEAFGRAMNVAKLQYEEATDPMQRVNREIKQEIDLLNVHGEARTVASQMQAIQNQMRERGIELSKEEKDALEKSIGALERKRAVDAEYSRIYEATVGAQQKMKDAITATSKAYDDGLLSIDGYKQALSELGKESLDVKLKAGTATFDEGMLASLGRLTDGYTNVTAGMSQSFGNFFQTVNDGFADSIGHAIVFGDSFKEAFGNVARQALSGLISSLVKLGMQYAVNAAIGQSLAAAATAGSVAEASILATAWATPAALASLASFGANSVPAMAAIASTTALAQGLAVGGMAGFESGGYTGNGGRKEVAGVVHGQEFVMNAEATARNRPMLEAMNNGASATKAAPTPAAPAAAESGTRIINVLDPSIVADYLSSPNGEKVILNVMRRNGK